MLHYNGNMLSVNNRALLQKSLEIKGQKTFLIKGLILRPKLTSCHDFKALYFQVYKIY